MTKGETLYMDIYDNGFVSNEYKEKFKHLINNFYVGVEENAEQQKRIHTLEVYLEGAVNYLILDGDVNNRIISNVETILHKTFNRSPIVPNIFQKLTKANLLLKDVYKIAMDDWNDPKWHDQVLRKAREYIKEIKEND